MALCLFLMMPLGKFIELATNKADKTNRQIGMKVFLHNSLTKKKEFFVPAQKNIVKIYVCGVTVYDLCHLGHARGAINFDVLKKLFQTLGYQVIFVKNYTDIDDKIIAESNKLKEPALKDKNGFITEILTYPSKN